MLGIVDNGKMKVGNYEKSYEDKSFVFCSM